MKRDRQVDELIEQWLILPQEQKLIATKAGTNQLGFALLLKFFQNEGRFPKSTKEITPIVINYVAKQVGLSPKEFANYEWQGRTIEYHRSQIRNFLGFREITVEESEQIIDWLSKNVVAYDKNVERVKAAFYQRCKSLCLEPPTSERVERLIRSCMRQHEANFCKKTLTKLLPSVQKNLESFLEVPQNAGLTTVETEPDNFQITVIQKLKADSGPSTLDSFFLEVSKLQYLRTVNLPIDLFAETPLKVLQAYKQRVMVEEPFEIRRHPFELRLTLLGVFCHLRSQEITDSLVELLLSIVHRISSKAEQRVEQQLVEELKHVTGKTNLLFQLAEAALDNPDGIIKNVLYPIASEETLRNIVKEWKAGGPLYRQQLRIVIRNSYRLHYRRLLPKLLSTLEFRSNNEIHRPVMEAIEVLKKYAGKKKRRFPINKVPLEGIIQPLWRDIVIEKTSTGKQRVNRITYEICVLQALCKQLKCKEIWVVGANRYGNPDNDLPPDFEIHRELYYKTLNLPLSADEFINKVKQELNEQLSSFDQSVQKNKYVKILDKAKGWISLSPLPAQVEPFNLSTLKADLAYKWPMTSLLDILKETALRTNFTEVFRSPTAWENLTPETLRKRLLLCLYGIGTNTGIKRMNAGEKGLSYKDLLYVKRRFITKEYLREAIVKVVNGIFQIRLPEIWGEVTTACASDSKKFGAWDQNLMTQWHVRYGGRGIMIYWHVERKSTCIYSQLKTCSSSEVAAMIEGVLRHCTDMEVEKQYVDSHGQSTVAFAFSSLLGFQLLPRLKAIHSQKLHPAETLKANEYPNLQLILADPINWDLIRQQYDQMVKFTTALRLGTTQAETILRRFTRDNAQHPTYKALSELGKAFKTIFLCRYLQSETLRREIEEGLNVIENWNSANSFILYGRGGEFATNRLDEQEIIMLSLHLLQISLVYINTLMIQKVLSESQWKDKLKPEDFRALTPLIYNHVNPYGLFRLDMNSRLVIE